MKNLLLTILLLSFVVALSAQPARISGRKYLKTNPIWIGYDKVVGEKGIHYPAGDGPPNDSLEIPANATKLASMYRDTTNHVDYVYDPSIGWTVSGGSGGGGGGIVPATATTSTPPAGFDPPGDSLTADEWIKAAFYASQPPTAFVTGGTTLELMSSGAALPYTLNWGAGRQSNTAELAQIIVADVVQTITTQPSPGNQNLGTQGVSVPRNVNTTYYNTVTTVDGKTTTASTTFVFSARRYSGWVATATPSDTEIRALANEFSSVSTKSWNQAGPGTSMRLAYAYPTTYGDLTEIYVNGFPSISAFTLTKRDFTNASGYTQQYNIYVSNNGFTGSSTTNINAVQ